MKKKLLKNWLMLICSAATTTILSFFTFTILGKKMTVDDYGLFSAILALASTASVFVNNIISGTVVNREIAVDSGTSRSVFRKALNIRTISFVLASIVLFFYTRTDGRINTYIFIVLIGILAFETFWELFEQVAFGLKITRYTTVLSIIFTIAWFAFVYIVSKDMATLLVMIIAYAAINIVKTIVYGLLVNWKTRPCVSQKEPSYFSMLKMSAPYLYLRLLGTVSTQIPILLLDGYSEIAQVSYYSVGEKFTTPITKLTMTAISAVFPFLTKAMKSDRDKAIKLTQTVLGLILALGACGSLLLSSTSEYWLVGIMGEKYRNAVEPFNYQIWFTVILSIDTVFSMILSSDYKQKTLAIITTIDIIVFLPFLYFGVKNGAMGLAIARLSAATLCMLYHIGVICFTYKYSVKKSYSLVLNMGIFIVLLACSQLIANRLISLLLSLVSFIICLVINRKQIIELLTLIKKDKVTASKDKTI